MLDHAQRIIYNRFLLHKYIKQIEGYLNKPIILGDEMLLSIDRVIIRLRFVDKKNDEYIFENVKLRCY